MIRQKRLVLVTLGVLLAVALTLMPLAKAETVEYPYTLFNMPYPPFNIENLNADWTQFSLNFSTMDAETLNGQTAVFGVNSTAFAPPFNIALFRVNVDASDNFDYFIYIFVDSAEPTETWGLDDNENLPDNVTFVLDGSEVSIYVQGELAIDSVEFTETDFSTALLGGNDDPAWESGEVTLTYSEAPEPTPTPTPTPPETLNLDSHRQFWYEGDLIGFFQAIYVSAFLNADLFYGVIAMLFLVPLYIKTRSLLLICILWIMLGSLFIAAFPLISGIAVLFLALGIGGLVFRLVRGTAA